jgi:D-amino-acid dehydrogenase
MKVAVIGAGIVGITSAFELTLDGHEVTVFERRGAAAEETSFANAGIVAPGYVTPWAAPGMPAKVLRHLFGRHSPVRVGLPLSNADLAWMARWYRSCRPQLYLANRARMHRLAFYSRQRLHDISVEFELDYDCSPGYLVMLRSDKDRDLAQPGLELMRQSGVPFSLLDAAGARLVEPALNPDTDFVGAVHLPDDGVANCRQVALLLKSEAQRRGAKFEFNKAVAQVDRARAATILIAGEAMPRHFDSIVLCGGVDSAALLAPLGLKLPLAAVYGYSISAPIGEALNAPRSAVMDERYKVAISRLGNRVRVAGSAEIGGSLQSRRTSSVQTLYKVLRDWFPGAAQHGNLGVKVQEWKGARPMLPDGPPVIGPSGLPGLWLNLGHGSSGWALSCGSARVLADLVGGRPAAIDMDGLGIERLQLGS